MQTNVKVITRCATFDGDFVNILRTKQAEFKAEVLFLFRLRVMYYFLSV